MWLTDYISMLSLRRRGWRWIDHRKTKDGTARHIRWTDSRKARGNETDLRLHGGGAQGGPG